MNYYKKLLIMKINKKMILSFLLFFLTTSSFLCAIEMDEWDPNELFLDDIGLETAGVGHVTTRTITPTGAMGVLLQIKPHRLLKNPVYLYTQPLRRREIIDEISFNFPRYNFAKSFSIMPFYHQMSQAQFKRDRTGIKDYIDMSQTDLINTINELALDYDDDDDNDVDLTSINIPDLLNLFANIKVQERLLGFMFQYTKKFENQWTLSWHFPLLYQEYNYFLTKNEISAIETSDFFKQFKTGDYWEFVTNHLLSDKLGIGDTRITLEKTIKESSAYRLNIGLDISLPTAFSIKKGVIGAYFDKKTRAPRLDLINDFLELNETGNNTQLLKNAEILALQILDRASTLLLEHPLGNYHHPACGIFTRSTLIFSPTVELTSKLRANLLIPVTERRFIKKNISTQELQALYDRHTNPATDTPNIDPATVDADLARLEEIFIEKFFPESYDVTVMPGLEISSSSQLTYERARWIFYIGTEMWYHTKESFLKIHTDSLTQSTLEIEKAKKEYAYQTKTWIGFDKKKRETSNWQYGARASASGINDGIGDTFTLSFHCVREF